MNEQEAFNIVWKGFIVDKAPFSVGVWDSEQGGMPCLYRGPNGEKCAIGMLLPDEKCTEYLNCQVLRHVLDFIPNRKFSLDFAYELQKCHDRAVFSREECSYVKLESNLRGLANKFNLTIPS